MQEIVYITDPRVLAISIAECYEPLVDLTNQSILAYGPPPECDLNEKDYTKLRKTVYDKLCLAQQALPKGWLFRIYEGYRSRLVQEQLFDQQFQRLAKLYPDWGKPRRFIETTRLVSPVKNLDGTPNIPVHNTGAAVDLEIIDANGQLLDMGMAAKDWNVVDPDLCLTDNPELPIKIRANRKLLCDVMQSQGFINYPTEWWHFSYGDRYWAYFAKQQQAIYGSADRLLT